MVCVNLAVVKLFKVCRNSKTFPFWKYMIIYCRFIDWESVRYENDPKSPVH